MDGKDLLRTPGTAHGLTAHDLTAKDLQLRRLRAIVDRLRNPGGCPWDRQQTLRDMSRYLLEESCEVADAIEEADGRPSPQVREELGDVLVNILLASRIAEDEGGFHVGEVASESAEKLLRRHPHVFGDARADSVEEVLTHWNAVKAAEKAGQVAPAQHAARDGAAGAAGKALGPTDAGPQDANGKGPPGATAPPSRLDGIPRSLPPLERAFEVGKKAARAGFDWPDAAGALAKAHEELGEVQRALEAPEDAQGRRVARLEEELGDLLFAVVSVCRKAGVRPESALRRTLKKFARRFRRIEARIPHLEGATLEAMEALWQEAKEERDQDPGPDESTGAK